MKHSFSQTHKFINYLKRVCAIAYYHDANDHRTKYEHKGMQELSLAKTIKHIAGSNNFQYNITWVQPIDFSIEQSQLSTLHILQKPLDPKLFGVELLVEGLLDKDIEKEFIVANSSAQIIIPYVEHTKENTYILKYLQNPINNLSEKQLDSFIDKIYHNLLEKPYFL